MVKLKPLVLMMACVSGYSISHAAEAAAKTEAAAEDVKNASKEATAHVAGAVEQGAADVKEKAQ
jgi:hypothetical protein